MGKKYKRKQNGMGSLNDQVLISIVVPIYNMQEYAERCIDSIINQSYTNLEIILVDDGSEDGSSAICDRYGMQDKRIKVIHKKNGGVVSARKAGISAAHGMYVVYVDGDDWIEKDRVHNVVKYILPEEPDMIYMSGYIQEYMGAHTEVRDEIIDGVYCGEQIRQELFLKIIDIKKCFKLNIRGGLWMWAIKREILQCAQILVDDRISMAEDQICVCLCLLKARLVRIIHESGYYYVQRPTSASYSVANDEKNRLKIWYQQLKHHLDLSNVSDEVMRVFVFLTVRLIMMSDYSLLLKNDKEYLFPYIRVKKNSKIVIYGLGKLGYHLVYALKESEDYKIVGLIDKNMKRFSVMDLEVNDASSLKMMEYDYVVIAILDEDIAKEASEQLVSLGIEREKIALMDYRVITENSIPIEFTV